MIWGDCWRSVENENDNWASNQHPKSVTSFLCTVKWFFNLSFVLEWMKCSFNSCGPKQWRNEGDDILSVRVMSSCPCCWSCSQGNVLDSLARSLFNPFILTMMSKSFQAAKRTTWTQGWCCICHCLALLPYLTWFTFLDRKAITQVRYSGLGNWFYKTIITIGNQSSEQSLTGTQGSINVTVLTQSSSLSSHCKRA